MNRNKLSNFCISFRAELDTCTSGCQIDTQIIDPPILPPSLPSSLPPFLACLQGPDCTAYNLTSQAKISTSVARLKRTLRYVLTFTNPAAKDSAAVPLDVAVTLPPSTTYKVSRVAPALKPKQAPMQAAELDGSTVLTWRNVTVKGGGKRTVVVVNLKVAANASRPGPPDRRWLHPGGGPRRPLLPDAGGGCDGEPRDVVSFYLNL
jgi:hypothetical protein